MVNEEPGKDLESISCRDVLIRFSEEYTEYTDTYHALAITNAVAKAAQDFSMIINHQEDMVLKTNDTSGLRKQYAALLEFEKKYPFIKKDFSQKALELSEIKQYLVPRDE